MRIEQVSALPREGQAALVVAKVDRLDEALVAQVFEGVVVDVEVVFGHDPKGADGGQRAAVLAVQLVDTVAIDDQLALLAARQVEVVHQAVARIVVVPVALVVHARPFVAAIPLAVFARITPSSVGHRALLAWVLLFGLSVKTPWQLLRGAGSGKRRSAGAFRRGVQGVVVWEPRLGAIEAIERWVRSAVLDTPRDQQPTGAASLLIRSCSGDGKGGGGPALEPLASFRAKQATGLAADCPHSVPVRRRVPPGPQVGSRFLPSGGVVPGLRNTVAPTAGRGAAEVEIVNSPKTSENSRTWKGH